MLMPSLLKLAGAPALDRAAIEGVAKHVDEALAAAEAAGYRIDKLAGEAEAAEAGLEPENKEALLDESGGKTAILSKNERLEGKNSSAVPSR